MKAKCIGCKKTEQILWSDIVWEGRDRPPFEINLCKDCVNFHMPYLMENAKTCLACGHKFISDKSWAKICLSCWIKKQNK